MISRWSLGALSRACHPAPTAAVTILAALLAVVAGLSPTQVVVLTVAVLTGQLSIGWSNDLIDAERDARVGRADKPIATGILPRVVVVRALTVVLVLCAITSLALGVAAGLVHLLLLVGAGWAYNAVLKGTWWSWLPYLVAFGSLPAVVWLAGNPPTLPPPWMLAVGALLGVGAHLLNVLPDLDDDDATAIRGLPHRLGVRASGITALLALSLASAVAVLGPAGTTPALAWLVLAAIVALAIAALRAGGRFPFQATMLIAVVNVMMLLVRAP